MKPYGVIDEETDEWISSWNGEWDAYQEVDRLHETFPYRAFIVRVVRE